LRRPPDVILVHGAFRGGWAWEPVVDALRSRGIEALAPDLPNAGGRYRPDHEVVDLQAAAEDLAEVVASVAPTAVVGHSQGALVVRCLLVDHADLVTSVGYLDGAVPDIGECAANLIGGSGDAPADVREALIDPPAPDDCLPRRLRHELRQRATPQHAAMAFDPVGASAFSGPVAWAFASGTPDNYPSAAVRARLERAGTPFEVLEGCHDLPMHRPDVVADWIVRRVLAR
jgi:pimeloyl-ACP methyl ester carboxylesterase